MAAPKSSPAEEIIRKSGHGLHSRVVKRLRELGWAVMISPYYSDNFTDKPREIDIIAERAFPVEHPGLSLYGSLIVRLFVECKYIVGETVFWLDEKDKEGAVGRIIADTGLGDPRRTGIARGHHYLTAAPVAKLSQSESGKGDDNDVISRAINQSLNALVYYRHRELGLATLKHRENFGRIAYPIIVTNSFDRFHSTLIGGDETPTKIVQPFQLEVNYAYTDRDRNGHNEYFLIDVVSIDRLADFLSSLEGTDVAALADAKMRGE